VKYLDATFLVKLPQFVETVSTYLRNASPAILIAVGALLFLFAGAAKWIIRLIGAGLFIYGLLAALHLI
jgi:hypothetical protein